MTKAGLYFIGFGIGSIILNAMGYEFTILMWLGEGHGVRLAIAAIGVAMIIIDQTRIKEEEYAEEENQ
jgi:hypothetical protein